MRSRSPFFLTGLCALILCCGCGSVAPPLPPSLHIPLRIMDLVALERGDKILVEFTLPDHTRDRVLIKQLGAVELQVVPLKPKAAAQVIKLAGGPEAPGPVHYEVPVGDWAGRDVQLTVRVTGTTGRVGEWSNEVAMRVVQPLLPPSDVKAEAAAYGVHLSWRSVSVPGIVYRVFRRGPAQKEFGPIGRSESAEYADTTALYDTKYEYRIQAALKAGESEAESLNSTPVSITAIDTFPPAVPSSVTAIGAAQAIQVSWVPDTEPDLKGYYVYRSVEGGSFERVNGLLDTPAYGDHAVQSGAHYRYEISAIDQKGNESARSAPVEAIAP